MASGEAPSPRGHSLVGLALMLAATAAFVGMSACVKLLREEGLSTPQVMLWRTLPALPWVAAQLHFGGGIGRPRAGSLVAWRCVFGLGAMAANFYAIRALTLVQHSVLSLLQPVFIAMLAPLLLAERLRAGSVAALGLALAGALVVIEPARGSLHMPVVPAALAVVAALCSAFAHMWIRRATGHDSPELVVFYFTLTTSAASLVWASSVDGRLLPPLLDTGKTALSIAAMAGLGLAGQLLMTRAYERAQAPAVAVVAYASIPLSFGVDVVAWGATAGGAALLGSALMVVAGVLLTRAGGYAVTSASAAPAEPPVDPRAPARRLHAKDGADRPG